MLNYDKATDISILTFSLLRHSHKKNLNVCTYLKKNSLYANHIINQCQNVRKLYKNNAIKGINSVGNWDMLINTIFRLHPDPESQGDENC